MKYFPILLFLLCTGCATTNDYVVYEYDIPAHKLIVCGEKVRRELYPQHAIAGRCYFRGNNKRIYCKPSVNNKKWVDPFVYAHEVRHFVEGNFHK